MVHLSTGDMLRAEMSSDSKISKEIQKCMRAGTFTPDHIVFEMLDNKLAAIPKNKTIILDGFPRTLSQAESLDKLIEKHKIVIGAVISIEVPDMNLIERLLLRGRADDTIDIIYKRLLDFHNLTTNILYFYEGKNLLLKIDGTKQEQEVFKDIAFLLNKR